MNLLPQVKFILTILFIKEIPPIFSITLDGFLIRVWRASQANYQNCQASNLKF